MRHDHSADPTRDQAAIGGLPSEFFGASEPVAWARETPRSLGLWRARAHSCPSSRTCSLIVPVQRNLGNLSEDVRPTHPRFALFWDKVPTEGAGSQGNLERRN